MGKVKIGLLQFFTLTVLFELGTALVVNLGMSAGRDAWMSILIGCLAGLVMFSGYVYLYRKHPDMPFTAYTRKHTSCGNVYCFIYEFGRPGSA
ncbi:Spore germination protein [compost metagenome]